MGPVASPGRTKTMNPISNKIQNFYKAGLFSLALAGLLGGFMTQSLNANTCQLSCNHVYACTMLQHGSNPANKARLINEKQNFLNGCIKGCSAHKAKSIACYKQSGGQVNISSCQANLMCMLPYMKSMQ